MSHRAVWIGVMLLGACRGRSETQDASGSERETGESAVDSSAASADTGEPMATTGDGAVADPDVHTYVPPSWPLAEPPARVVFLGDSITVGTGATSTERDYVSLLLANDEESYPLYAGQDLSSWFGDIDAITAAMGGATTETVLNVQLPAIEEALGPQPEGLTLVVGTIGGNDVSNVVFGLKDLGEERERIATNTDQIARWFLDEQRFPDGAMVYLTNVYEPTDGSGQSDACFFGLDISFVQDDFDALNARTRELAQASGWSWVDLRGHFLGHGHNHDDEDNPHYDPTDPSLWLVRDCIHPNNRGHHEIRRLFLSAIDNRPLPL